MSEANEKSVEAREPSLRERLLAITERTLESMRTGDRQAAASEGLYSLENLSRTLPRPISQRQADEQENITEVFSACYQTLVNARHGGPLNSYLEDISTRKQSLAASIDASLAGPPEGAKSRAEFDAMSPSERMTFMKAGGKLY